MGSHTRRPLTMGRKSGSEPAHDERGWNFLPSFAWRNRASVMPCEGRDGAGDEGSDTLELGGGTDEAAFDDATALDGASGLEEGEAAAAVPSESEAPGRTGHFMVVASLCGGVRELELDEDEDVEEDLRAACAAVPSNSVGIRTKRIRLDRMGTPSGERAAGWRRNSWSGERERGGGPPARAEPVA